MPLSRNYCRALSVPSAGKALELRLGWQRIAIARAIARSRLCPVAFSPNGIQFLVDPLLDTAASTPALATIVRGSLARGLEARLNPGVSVEAVRVGMFVVVGGQRGRYFGLVTDIVLTGNNPQIAADPPLPEETLLAEVLLGTGVYTTITVVPMLVLSDERPGDVAQLLPVKTIPAHFSQVYAATAADFAQVFGAEGDRRGRRFAIGSPLDGATAAEVPICLDLDRWVERSNGIFGKTGTGKSFLARVILAGIIRTRAAVNLIFDMHSEYGWEATSEGDRWGGVGANGDRVGTRTGGTVKGLRQLFPGQVEIYTLDPDSTRRRGVRDARELAIDYSQIEVDDIALLRGEMNVSQTSLENAAILRSELGRDWIGKLLEMSGSEIQDFCDRRMGHMASIVALQRKLTRLQRLNYLHRPRAAADVPTERSSNGHPPTGRSGAHPSNGDSSIDRILASLEAGKHVVIEFGAQASALSYMLASNIITRRIHRAYIQKAERYLYSKNPADKPRQLVVTIEEAHRFLGAKTFEQTIYGTIAREMRKYFVTLLVVDQRPSGIDREVLSQLGTRIAAALDDGRDLEAVLTGVAGGESLRSILARLETQQQAMVVGQAVPMPVVVRTRAYDEGFYAAVGQPDWSEVGDEEVAISGAQARWELGL